MNLGTGFISALKYALVLHQLPIGIFIVAFNVAVFPWISDYSAAEKKEKLESLYYEGISLKSNVHLDFKKFDWDYQL